MDVHITTTPAELEQRIALAWHDGYNAGHKDGMQDAITTEDVPFPRQAPWERAVASARRGVEYIVMRR